MAMEPTMQITLDLPEDIARQLETGGHDLSRSALEALALEGYRSGVLSESQVRRLLCFGTRYEVHGFLKEHGVPLRYSEQDLENDIENARRFSEKWLSSQTPHR
jgi:predicted HTH domain antitoxin